MLLNEYVENCVAYAKFRTKQTLTLGPPLLPTFRNLRGASELEVKERGVYLFWDSNTKQLQTSKPIAGTGERLDFDTKNVSKDVRYIGDCHTHPWKQKLGPEARIGPSTQDYKEWWNFPPTKFHNFGVHFVISSATVFLIITRAKTEYINQADTNTRLDASFGKVTDDTEPMRMISVRCAEDDAFNSEYTKTRPDRTPDFDAQRQAITSHKELSKVPAKYAELNKKMNVELANKLYCEYFMGEMDGSGKALQVCELALKSNRVYT